MGTQNSRSSFKNNSSMIQSTNNGQGSEQFSFSNSNNKSVSKDVDILTKFTWNYGGSTVLLTGSFNRWKQTIPLQRHGDEFSITIALVITQRAALVKVMITLAINLSWMENGGFRQKTPRCRTPTETQTITSIRRIFILLWTIRKGNLYDIGSEYSGPVFNQNKQKQTQAAKEGQLGTVVEEFPKVAPMLPVHYDFCEYLSDASAQEQKQFSYGSKDSRFTFSQMMDVEGQDKKRFQLSLSDQELRQIFNSCHCLAPPNHVTVDHVIMETKKQYEEIAITQRFKSKYTTYRYYS